MLSFAPIRPLVANWRGWLPAAALPLAMFIALWALGGDRGFLYRAEGDHDWGTVKNLSIAENLSPEHNFLMALKIWRDEDGGSRYILYSRFPIGGYVLIKLALLPFGGDLAAKLMAARALMLNAVRVLRVLRALLRRRGFRRERHGHVRRGDGVSRHGRIRPRGALPPKAVALLRAARASCEKSGVSCARSAIIALVRSRHVVLAAVAILFSSAPLAFNFANEYMG